VFKKIKPRQNRQQDVRIWMETFVPAFAPVGHARCGKRDECADRRRPFRRGTTACRRARVIIATGRSGLHGSDAADPNDRIFSSARAAPEAAEKGAKPLPAFPRINIKSTAVKTCTSQRSRLMHTYMGPGPPIAPEPVFSAGQPRGNNAVHYDGRTST